MPPVSGPKADAPVALRVDPPAVPKIVARWRKVPTPPPPPSAESSAGERERVLSLPKEVSQEAFLAAPGTPIQSITKSQGAEGGISDPFTSPGKEVLEKYKDVVAPHLS